MSDGGKGSAPRPFSVSNAEYASRWDAIFGRDQQPKIPALLAKREVKVALPGCELACESYSQCPRRTPCDRLDEYNTKIDEVDGEAADD